MATTPGGTLRRPHRKHPGPAVGVRRRRTIGEVLAGLADLTLGECVVLVAFVVVIAGSLGPWATTVLGQSVAGTTGDGWITLGLAAAGIWYVVVRGLQTWGRVTFVVVLALGAAAIGIYDRGNIDTATKHALWLGVQVAHVGWGVQAVVAGGIVAAIAAAITAWRGRGQP